MTLAPGYRTEAKNVIQVANANITKLTLKIVSQEIFLNPNQNDQFHFIPSSLRVVFPPKKFSNLLRIFQFGMFEIFRCCNYIRNRERELNRIVEMVSQFCFWLQNNKFNMFGQNCILTLQWKIPLCSYSFFTLEFGLSCITTSVTTKIRQMSIKVAQKLFQEKNDRF